MGNIPEIGPQLAGRLVDSFGTIENIAQAPEKDLQAVEGIGYNKARKIQWILREPERVYGQ